MSQPDSGRWRGRVSRSPARLRSARGSEGVRSRCPQAVERAGAQADSGGFSRFRFGIGSVRCGGSVGQGKNPSGSSTFSCRTPRSELLKIRVSTVRFRPWPPFPSGAFRSHGLHVIQGTWLTRYCQVNSPRPRLPCRTAVRLLLPCPMTQRCLDAVSGNEPPQSGGGPG